MDACLSNVPTHRADHSVVLPYAHLHDVQRVAVLRGGSGRSNRLLPLWLEKVRCRRRYGTLSLTEYVAGRSVTMPSQVHRYDTEEYTTDEKAQPVHVSRKEKIRQRCFVFERIKKKGCRVDFSVLRL